MRTIRLLLPLLLLMAAGCAAPSLDMAKVAELYYRQPRNYQVLSVQGVKHVTLTGDNVRLAVSAEMQPLSIWPRDPGTAQTVVRELSRGVLTGLGIVTAGDVMKDMSDTHVVNPVVVEPSIVRPEIVTP